MFTTRVKYVCDAGQISDEQNNKFWGEHSVATKFSGFLGATLDTNREERSVVFPPVASEFHHTRKKKPGGPFFENGGVPTSMRSTFFVCGPF